MSKGKGKVVKAEAVHSHRRTCCPWCGNDLLFIAVLRAFYEEATRKKPRPRAKGRSKR